MLIVVEDPAVPDVRALLEEHLAEMYSLSPPESVHALDLERLRVPAVTFWTAREDGTLLGCGALYELSPEEGEIKSMRTTSLARRRGVARAVLEVIVAEALQRGYRRLNLETGSQDSFAPARALYSGRGFVECEPFGSYTADPNSVFMTLALDSASRR